MCYKDSWFIAQIIHNTSVKGKDTHIYPSYPRLIVEEIQFICKSDHMGV